MGNIVRHSRTPQSRTPLTKISGTAKEAQQRARFDTERRKKAVGILAPDVIASGRDNKPQSNSSHTAYNLLMTTLDGHPRMITAGDLAKFTDSVKRVGKQFKGGITAQQSINLSLGIDRKRANEHIKWAMFAGSRGSVFRFVTSASGRTPGVHRHFVEVDFLEFTSAVSAPLTAQVSAKRMSKGHLRFNCDCGRHTFWYRYVASIGGFALGRIETGFPKIRNPQLSGVACKHVLRVMHMIAAKDSTTLKAITQAIETQRFGKNVVTVTQKQADAHAKAIEHNNASILTSTEKLSPTRLLKKVGQALQLPHHKEHMAAEKGLSVMQKLGVISGGMAQKLLNKIKGQS
jgi:hypothetical protein